MGRESRREGSKVASPETPRLSLQHLRLRKNNLLLPESRVQGRAEHPAVGEVSSSIPPRLQLRQACSSIEHSILVQRTIPEGVSVVPSSTAEVTNKLAQHRASHNAPIPGLQVVRAAELFWLPIMVAEAAVLHFLPIHVDGKDEKYKV